MTSTEKIIIEDVLKHLLKCEQKGQPPTLESISGVLQLPPDKTSNVLTQLVSHKMLEIVGTAFNLTDSGRTYALQVLRAHRLWERFLADETGYDETEWHALAEKMEHDLTPEEIEALAARLGHPRHDPHGDPIPTPEGELVPHGGQPLTSIEVGSTTKIVHLEDEPPIVYAQLVAEALYPGMALTVVESTPERVKFSTNGDTHVLAPIVARNISVVPVSAPKPAAAKMKLSRLKVGEKAQVIKILPTCRGAERRRFVDLGILPGMEISAEMVSPGGDPTAYRIVRSLIALRKTQADQIEVEKITDNS